MPESLDLGGKKLLRRTACFPRAEKPARTSTEKGRSRLNSQGKCLVAGKKDWGFRGPSRARWGDEAQNDVIDKHKGGFCEGKNGEPVPGGDLRLFRRKISYGKKKT